MRSPYCHHEQHPRTLNHSMNHKVLLDEEKSSVSFKSLITPNAHARHLKEPASIEVVHEQCCINEAKTMDEKALRPPALVGIGCANLNIAQPLDTIEIGRRNDLLTPKCLDSEAFLARLKDIVQDHLHQCFPRSQWVIEHPMAPVYVNILHKKNHPMRMTFSTASTSLLHQIRDLNGFFHDMLAPLCTNGPPAIVFDPLIA
jgi:hypothetical protein